MLVGCLIRTAGVVLVLLVLAVGARRLLEKPAEIPRPGSGERDTVVDGVRWRSRESGAGPPGETVVLFVHGYFSSSLTWKHVLSTAAGGHAAVAVDLPGAGFSDRPWPYDYTVFGQAQHLLRYLDARGFDRVILVGSSLGGAVCEAVAAARPERVAGLILVDAASPLTRAPAGFRLLRTPGIGDVQIEFLVRPVMAWTLRHRLYAREDRVTEATIDDWWVPIRVPGTRRAALNAIRTSYAGSEGLLAKIRAPTLVVWGQEDHLLSSSEGLALAAAIPGAAYAVVPGAGHLPQEELPEAFASVTAPFLLRLEPGGNR